MAFAVLHSAIQTDTHDSIEDARTALQLYETQQREEAEGSWEDTLEDIYREGRLTVRLIFLIRGGNHTELTLRHTELQSTRNGTAWDSCVGQQ